METMSRLLLIPIFAATVALALLAFEGGLRFGRWRSRQPDPEPQLPVRTLVASTLGLLAFILGFTFGLASSHFDVRSRAVSDEAIAIGIAYHRADLLPDSERADIRRLLMEYVDLRLYAGQSRKPDDVVPQLRKLQRLIWVRAVAAAKADSGSASPLMQSLTEVFDVHGERVLSGFRSRIPFRVWIALYTIMTIAVAAAGYLAGLSGARRSHASLAYALVFAAVITMIAAGDIPGPGQVRKNHETFTNLRARLTEQ